MKSETPMPRKSGANRRHSGTGLTRLPMEWMDPLSWRLPSGQALAEFALQTGFLAPLLMRGPHSRQTQKSAVAVELRGSDRSAGESKEGLGEAPARMASFRHNR
jgi:hypothetical protein